jgi:hypothetical protein
VRNFVISVALAVLALGLLDAKDAKWIEKRVQEIKKNDITAWRAIPWAATLEEARKQSAEEKRPIFLFTHDGNIETGRC